MLDIGISGGHFIIAGEKPPFSARSGSRAGRQSLEGGADKVLHIRLVAAGHQAGVNSYIRMEVQKVIGQAGAHGQGSRIGAGRIKLGPGIVDEGGKLVHEIRALGLDIAECGIRALGSQDIAGMLFLPGGIDKGHVQAVGGQHGRAALAGAVDGDDKRNLLAGLGCLGCK